MGPYLLTQKTEEVFADLVSKENDGDSFLGQKRGSPGRVYGMGHDNKLRGLLWNLKKAAETNPKQATR